MSRFRHWSPYRQGDYLEPGFLAFTLSDAWPPVELEDDLPDRERQMLKLIAAEPEPPVDRPSVGAADQDRPGRGLAAWD
jgi:hypothetical protein